MVLEMVLLWEGLTTPEEFSVCGTVPIAPASVLIVHHNQSSNDHKAPSNNKYRTVYPITL